jgi:hypothetical protein
MKKTTREIQNNYLEQTIGKKEKRNLRLGVDSSSERLTEYRNVEDTIQFSNGELQIVRLNSVV